MSSAHNNLITTGLHPLYMLQWASERGLQWAAEAAYRQGSRGRYWFSSLRRIVRKGWGRVLQGLRRVAQEAFRARVHAFSRYSTGVGVQRQSQEGCHENYCCLRGCGCRHRLCLHLWIQEEAQWLTCKSPCAYNCKSSDGLWRTKLNRTLRCCAVVDTTMRMCATISSM